jgi:hypothetical protein
MTGALWQRKLSIYDGRDRLGWIEIADGGEARAFDQRGRKLGTFSNLEAASAAFNSGRNVKRGGSRGSRHG